MQHDFIIHMQSQCVYISKNGLVCKAEYGVCQTTEKIFTQNYKMLIIYLRIENLNFKKVILQNINKYLLCAICLPEESFQTR